MHAVILPSFITVDRKGHGYTFNFLKAAHCNIQSLPKIVHCTTKILTIKQQIHRAFQVIGLTTPITEGSQPLYKARGPSSRRIVDSAW